MFHFYFFKRIAFKIIEKKKEFLTSRKQNIKVLVKFQKNKKKNLTKLESSLNSLLSSV